MPEEGQSQGTGEKGSPGDPAPDVGSFTSRGAKDKNESNQKEGGVVTWKKVLRMADFTGLGKKKKATGVEKAATVKKKAASIRGKTKRTRWHSECGGKQKP